MSDPESDYESEDAEDRLDYLCNSDSDSDSESLIKKFDSKYSKNRLYRIENPQSYNWTREEEIKIILCVRFVQKYVKNLAESGQQDSHSHSVRPQTKRLIRDDNIDRVWKKWALDSFMTIRGNIEHYNKGGAYFFVNVAGYYKKDSRRGLGIGVLIRNWQGVPIAALSYLNDKVEQVSAFYQEMRASRAGINVAIKLGIKYMHLICTSADVSIALSNCDRESPCEDDDMVYKLSREIMLMLQTRRRIFQEEDANLKEERFYFSNFAGGKMDNISARYLARLRETVDWSPEELMKHDALMDIIFKDAKGLSGVNLFWKGK